MHASTRMIQIPAPNSGTSGMTLWLWEEHKMSLMSQTITLIQVPASLSGRTTGLPTNGGLLSTCRHHIKLCFEDLFMDIDPNSQRLSELPQVSISVLRICAWIWIMSLGFMPVKQGLHALASVPLSVKGME